VQQSQFSCVYQLGRINSKTKGSPIVEKGVKEKGTQRMKCAKQKRQGKRTSGKGAKVSTNKKTVLEDGG